MVFAGMLGIYGLSVWLDGIWFADVAVGASGAGAVALKLTVHTMLVALYLGLAAFIVRRKNPVQLES